MRCNMEKEVLNVLNWLAAHVPQIVQLLTAVTPVLALLVVGYALHVLLQLHISGKEK